MPDMCEYVNVLKRSSMQRFKNMILFLVFVKVKRGQVWYHKHDNNNKTSIYICNYDFVTVIRGYRLSGYNCAVSHVIFHVLLSMNSILHVVLCLSNTLNFQISSHCWPRQRWNTDFLRALMNSGVIALPDVVREHRDFCPLGAQLPPQYWNMVISHSCCVKLVFLCVCLCVCVCVCDKHMFFFCKERSLKTQKRWALVRDSGNILLPLCVFINKAS